MAAELITPVDDFSGLPLPLMPVDEVLPTDDGSVANWHHHFHPASDPALTGSSGGRALRSARIQLVPVEHHNFTETAYHRFYAGPPIPTDRDEQFGMCVLSCAGYVPELAVDVTTGSPEVVMMSDSQLERLRMVPEPELPGLDEVGRFRDRHMPEASLEEADEALTAKRLAQAQMSLRNLRYGYDPMKAFFSEIVLDQDLSDVKSSVRNKFLNGDDTQGMSLLAIAACQAVEMAVIHDMSVDELYGTAYDEGRLHPQMPRTAASLVKYKLGNVDSRLKLLPELRNNMLYGGEEAAS